MRHLDWNVSHLNHLKLGKCGELIIQGSFLMYGFNVYIPLVDDNCVDLIITKKTSANYYKIQVKTVNLLDQNSTYIYLPKHRCQLGHDFYVALVVFLNNSLPELFLIPSTIWLRSTDEEEKRIFVSRDYEGKESKPEWGVNLSKKYLDYLRKKYRFADIVTTL